MREAERGEEKKSEIYRVEKGATYCVFLFKFAIYAARINSYLKVIFHVPSPCVSFHGTGIALHRILLGYTLSCCFAFDFGFAFDFHSGFSFFVLALGFGFIVCLSLAMQHETINIL